MYDSATVGCVSWILFIAMIVIGLVGLWFMIGAVTSPYPDDRLGVFLMGLVLSIPLGMVIIKIMKH